jgi:hypothetical protein
MITSGSAIAWPLSHGEAFVAAGTTYGVDACCRTFVAIHGSFAGFTCMVGPYVIPIMCPTVLLLLKNLQVTSELGLLLQLIVVADAIAAAIAVKDASWLWYLFWHGQYRVVGSCAGVAA